ncbi:MAG: ribonuclease P protein component [Lacisediminihabitans sp.]
MNRVVRAEDYRRVVRRGRKVGSSHFVSYVFDRTDDGPVRFGFIVAKNVGNAVIRNRVRRRLKAASFDLLSRVRPGVDVVVRALPISAGATWVTLRGEMLGIAARAEVKK